ncbi:MAG: MarR family winged helix-turn-helix transcriptional regulator [Acidimicrobiales bacterium]
MDLSTSPDQELVLAVADSWDRLLARLESGLSHVTGITFAEYRLLRAIARSPQQRASRVDLAERVGLSPSGVTRALQPLEKLGFVETQRGERDARLALAGLTPHGETLVRDASAVVDDVAASILDQAPDVAASRQTLVALLADLAS